MCHQSIFDSICAMTIIKLSLQFSKRLMYRVSVSFPCPLETSITVVISAICSSFLYLIMLCLHHVSLLVVCSAGVIRLTKLSWSLGLF